MRRSSLLKIKCVRCNWKLYSLDLAYSKVTIIEKNETGYLCPRCRGRYKILGINPVGSIPAAFIK